MHIALYLTFLALPLLGVAMMASGGKAGTLVFTHCTGIFDAR